LYAIAGINPYLRLRIGAALALLQPGIDPVFLVLLSGHSGLSLADHGLVVGASQAGMAAGALCAALVPHLPRRSLASAAAAGILACIATVAVDGLIALLIIRAVFGFTAGLLYAASLRAAAAQAPAHALGTIMALQLAAATLVALLLPAVATFAGPGVALLCLAVVPLANLALLVPDSARPAPASAATPAPRFDANVVAAFLFVAASMMIWSYIGARAVAVGLSDQTVGMGIALGSVAAGAAAMAVARGACRLPIPLAGLLAAVAMASPFVAPATTAGFGAAMIAFNIGATYAFARFSAVAIERDDAARRLVPAIQAAAMVAGPLCAAAAVGRGGFAALATVSITALAAAVAMLAVGSLRSGFVVLPRSRTLFAENAAADIEGALTET
jgi:hypothetical protein